MHSEYNLISYSAIPESNSVDSVLFDLGNQVTSIITEGLASVLLSDGWYGSLTHIEPSRGYWLRAPDEDVMGEDTILHVIEDAIPTPQDFEYLIHPDYNLISYVGSDGMGLDEALPDDIEMNITSLCTAGKAAMRTNDGNWIGSLTEWNVLTGYWANVYIDGNMETLDTLTFSFIDSEGLSRNNKKKIAGTWKRQIPSGFEYYQSTNQAFYFIDDIIIDDVEISPEQFSNADLDGN